MENTHSLPGVLVENLKAPSEIDSIFNGHKFKRLKSCCRFRTKKCLMSANIVYKLNNGNSEKSIN